jgi:hypothetical protein
MLSRIARTCISRRSLSVAVAVEAPPDTHLPIRHSRHAPPPACLSPVQLNEVSQEVLETPPGLLIPYESSTRDDSFHAWEVADRTIQKVEWLIRGYSAQVNNTQQQNLYSVDVDSNEDPANCVTKIQDLMRKMEKEGKLYMDLRHKMRSQLALEDQNERDMDELEDEPDISMTTPQVFASPGQTIGMFDALLDTMSMATGPATPVQVGDLLKRVNERFDQDGGLQFNVNPNTVPTRMTFNAGLRAIANTQNDNEKTRDDAIMYAFATYDALQDANVKRNAATYAYMIQTVSKFIPASEMSGNIAHAMWLLAAEHQVVDTNVMKAMELVECGEYEEYQTFLQETIRGKTIHDIPHHWRKFGKSLRYSSDDDTY